MNTKALGLFGVLLTVNTPCFSSVDVQAMNAEDLVEAAHVLEYIGEGGRSERFLDLATQKGSLQAQVELASNIEDLDERFKEYDRLIKKGSGEALYKKALLLKEKSDILSRQKCSYVSSFIQKHPTLESQEAYFNTLFVQAFQDGIENAVFWISDPMDKLLAADKVGEFNQVYEALEDINPNIEKSIQIFERLRKRPLSSVEYEEIGYQALPFLGFNSKSRENALYLFKKSCEMGNQDSCYWLSNMYASSPWQYMDIGKSLAYANAISKWPPNLSWAATVGFIPKPGSGVSLNFGTKFEIIKNYIDRNYDRSYQYAISEELAHFKKFASERRHYLSNAKIEILENYQGNINAVDLLAYGYIHDGKFKNGYDYLNKFIELSAGVKDRDISAKVDVARNFLFIMTHEGVGCDKDEEKAWAKYGDNKGRLYALRSLKAGVAKNVASPLVREAIGNDFELGYFDLIGLHPEVDTLSRVKCLLKTQNELIDVADRLFKQYFSENRSLERPRDDSKQKLAKYHSLRLEKLNELYTICSLLADKGDPKGQYMLGLLQMRMTNFDDAIILFNKAAASGCKEAHSELAKMYFWGLGTEPNIRLAVEQLEAQGLTTSDAYVELANNSNDIYFTDMKTLLLDKAIKSDSSNFHAWEALIHSECMEVYEDRDYALRLYGKACDAVGGMFCNEYKSLKSQR